MSTRATRIALALGCLALASCAEDAEVGTTPVPASVGDGVDLDLGTTPYRPRRRMDVDQLDASITRVTGGIAWERGSTNQFQRYAATLGVPDYAQTTSEDLTVSPLFLKFVDDAARYTCDLLLRRETGEEARGVFFVHATVDDRLPGSAAAIDDNFRYLLLRYHGRRVEPGSRQLEPWRDLLSRAAAATLDPDDPEPEPRMADAWEAVCVALINHPDFYTY